MFNKKNKRIEELEIQLSGEKNKVDNLQKAIDDWELRNLDLKSENSELKTKIIELESCFKPQTTICEEEVVEHKKSPRKTSKTVKKA